ncbi:MAG: hypothetical protein IPJ46_15355 [Anaerolineales bacterium]|nr:hypothetical protein [Anaerolineales bacterium]
MDFLLEPNIAYLILMGGILLGLMAIISPGTGLFEIGAFFLPGAVRICSLQHVL